jgi:hypothetical protein
MTDQDERLLANIRELERMRVDRESAYFAMGNSCTKGMAFCTVWGYPASSQLAIGEGVTMHDAVQDAIDKIAKIKGKDKKRPVRPRSRPALPESQRPALPGATRGLPAQSPAPRTLPGATRG